MMMRHNKKRNVGIIYEQLSQAFSQALVEKNQNKSMLIKKIIDEHYEKEGEIFKEFKIFNALLKVHASSDSLATNILKEAKSATISLNRKKLEIEKSLLIKDINYTLHEDDFYSRPIPDYRNLATLQSLMNLWQHKPKNNLQRLVEYETKAHSLLREEKSKVDIKSHLNPEVDSLVVKIMREKFQKKYKPILSDRQSRIIESYVCGDIKMTKHLLKELKGEVVGKIKLFEKSCENTILLEKSGEVICKVTDLDETLVDDDNIAKFLLACKLCEQLEEKR
jgi:hypothetical protein